MTDDLEQLSKAGFHRIHVISSVLNYRRRLATALIKLLSKPKFMAIDPTDTALPDKDFAWDEVDLLFVDLSEHKQELRPWFFDLSTLGQLPPTIFLDNNPTVDDAGDMVRAGAADYLDSTTMDTRRLARALLIAASKRKLPPEALEEARAKGKSSSVASVDFLIDDELATSVMPALKATESSETDGLPAIEGMSDEPTEYLPPVSEDEPAEPAPEKDEDEEAEFLTTGLIDILDRIKLEQASHAAVDISGTNPDFLTTGLMSILEREKLKNHEQEAVEKPKAQATEFAVGHRWPFTQEELEQRTASVGDYYIREFLAVGGTASIFKVHSKMGGKALAMKLFDSELGDDQGKERFLRGYRLIAPISHPNLVSIREVNEEKGVAFVVMELIEGGDLKSQIEKGVSRIQAVQYTVEIAQALDAAHEHDILHRDLKPSNVLIREDGTLALVDFGIAKLMAEGQTNVTQAGHVVGTSHYISPEQAVSGDVDGRSDLYSLGVILYEMLEGKRPYVGSSAVDIMQQHVRAPLPSLSSEKDPLNAVIQKMMAKKPEDRYANGEEINKALVEAVPDLVENFC